MGAAGIDLRAVRITRSPGVASGKEPILLQLTSKFDTFFRIRTPGSEKTLRWNIKTQDLKTAHRKILTRDQTKAPREKIKTKDQNRTCALNEADRRINRLSKLADSSDCSVASVHLLSVCLCYYQYRISAALACTCTISRSTAVRGYGHRQLKAGLAGSVPKLQCCTS